MRLFDTLRQEPVQLDFADEVVTMYVCGLTPYDASHLGHARVGIVYDTLRRYLEWRGLTVRYVQNVTDIDDPLFERARRDGVDWRVLGDQQTERYLKALARINVERPSLYIKATDEIEAIIANIATLVEQGHAYQAGGGVYYNIASKPDFGTIAHASYEQLLEMANERGNNPADPNKRDPLDFVLWQPSAADEPAWETPWGPGRPGWHIECSTISTRHLGPQIDIHGGGTDLIFPHHACEIAQAEPITGVVPFVRSWMHVGMVSLDGEKMSKSLGNMVFVDDLLETFSPNAVRLATLNKPYRDPYEHSPVDMEAAEQQVAQIMAALEAQGEQAPVNGLPLSIGHRERFEEMLDNDFNTPEAIKVMLALATSISEDAAVERDVQAYQQTLREMAGVLGLVV